MTKAGSRLVPGVLFICSLAVFGQEAPLPQAWDYVEPMKKVAAESKGRLGVVLHIGDSITYSNPYGQWARYGKGKSAEDQAVLEWMHCGAQDDTDGWWLAAFDHPRGGRSYTACSGIRVDQMLRGGVRGMPSPTALLDQYRPQIVILMLGTNDASANRPLDAYRADMARAMDQILAKGTICILSTIPPHPGRAKLAATYNEALRALARTKGLPLIDLEKEILKRRPDDWNGTLLGLNDVHLSARFGGTSPPSPPTVANLRNSGYLLRGWLSVKKIAEVKRSVIDGLPLRLARRAPNEAALPTVKAPEGEKVRAEITRDVWLSNYKEEANCNLGGASRLKVKSIQEMSILDIDPAALKGRVINGATLHLRVSGKEILHRLTVSTVGAEWIEGTSPSYNVQAESSSYAARKYPSVPWAFAESDLNAVMLSRGGTIWRMADTFPPDRQGWQKVAVEPTVVAARVAGVSYGFLIFDDTGSEWTRNGEQFEHRTYPNRFVYSREAGRDKAPYFTLYLGETDRSPPAAPTQLASAVDELPAGEAWLSWVTPKDAGPAGTLGFFVAVNGKAVPRYLIPPAGAPEEKVRMHLRDLGLTANQRVTVAVRAVDGAGNSGAPASLAVRVSGKYPAPLPGVSPRVVRTTAPLPNLGETEVAIIDALDKVHPVSGKMIPAQAPGYLAANHLWSARESLIRLYAARNEFVTFQVLLKGEVGGIRPALSFEGDRKGLRESFFSYRHVESANGPLPDPVLPLTGPFSVPSKTEPIPGQKFGSILCELFVPHGAAVGEAKGALTLKAQGGTLTIPVTLTVWNFTLPDYLSFLPEMNCYGLPANERDYYRLAHLHRTVVNRLPYSQSGHVARGCAPSWDGQELGWAAWDERFGGYLDGSAFGDLPRREVPLECFYLPLHENWPSPIDAYYNEDYWADRAFRPGYRETFTEVARQFAQHLEEKGWHDTLFHCYLNNKMNYKRRGWSRGSSPWLLDEPSNFQDYWALRYFGEAFHEGINLAGGEARLVYRCDISRPQWQRNSLDHVLDYNVVGSGPFRRYNRIVMDWKAAFGQIVVNYGSTNAIEASNMQPVGWCIDSWALGTDGVVPWQTIGRGESWEKADRLSLFYPGESIGLKGPIPSIRLKAYCRGEQVIEYLTLLAQVMGEPRWAIGESVRKALRLVARIGGTGFVGDEDAGVVSSASLMPQDVWKLRVRVGEVLSKARPGPKRRLVDFRTPRRDPSKGAPGYVSVGEVPQVKTRAAAPAGPVATKALQGPGVVDTIIDPPSPDKNFGNVTRDNRVKRTDVCNAFLVRFDIGELGLKPGAKVQKGTVSFFVWDPSSRGNSKVCAFPLKTAWEEMAATWRQPAAGRQWKGGAAFRFGADTGPASAPVIVPPDKGRDTANPPLEYRIDVTDMVKGWVSGKSPNYGMAIAPVIDRSVDDGHWTRFQVIASERQPVRYTPKLAIELAE